MPETEEPQAPAAPEQTSPPEQPEEPEEQADQPGTESHDDPASIDVVVNKARPLEPADYYPADLRSPNVTTGPGGAGAQLRAAAAGAAEEMFAAAAAEGVSMTIVSGFRSYDTQVSTYQHWVNVNGKAGADEVSARPGYSEHQTGLALDIGDSSGACNLSACFADTAPAAGPRRTPTASVSWSATSPGSKTLRIFARAVAPAFYRQSRRGRHVQQRREGAGNLLRIARCT